MQVFPYLTTYCLRSGPMRLVLISPHFFPSYPEPTTSAFLHHSVWPNCHWSNWLCLKWPCRFIKLHSRHQFWLVPRRLCIFDECCDDLIRHLIGPIHFAAVKQSYFKYIVLLYLYKKHLRKQAVFTKYLPVCRYLWMCLSGLCNGHMHIKTYHNKLIYSRYMLKYFGISNTWKILAI